MSPKCTGRIAHAVSQGGAFPAGFVQSSLKECIPCHTSACGVERSSSDVIRYDALHDPRTLPTPKLVALCAGSHDTALWEEFVRRFQPVISGCVCRTLREFGAVDMQVAEDLIQDAFVRLCDSERRALREFNSVAENAFYGVARLAAVCSVRDHMRKRSADRRGGRTLTMDLEELHDCSELRVTDNPDRRIELRRIDDELAADTGTHSTRNRMVFWLRHRHGYSAAEIARMPVVGLTPKGVETLLARLTDKLKSSRNSDEHSGEGNL